MENKEQKEETKVAEEESKDDALQPSLSMKL